MPDATESPVFVPASAVERLLDIPSVVAELRSTYLSRQSDASDARRAVAYGKEGARIRALAAALPAHDLVGAKLHVQPADAGSRFVILLFSQREGSLLGMVDGRLITELRTAATTALALDAMLSPGPIRVALLGSGREARAHARALAQVRDIERMWIFSPSQAHREQRAAELHEELGVAIEATRSAEDAVAACSVIVAAARSRDEQPIFDPRALRPGTTVASVGSTLPAQRELDTQVLAKADIVIGDDPSELLEQSGDCIAAVRGGVDLKAKMFSLSELLQGTLPRPLDPTATNVFKSIGSGLQDLTVAGLVLREALSAGAGIPLPIDLISKGAYV